MLNYFSGEVPGGIVLMIFLLVVMNLALRFLYKSSKLFSGEEYRRKALKGNIFLFGVYLILWLVLKPSVLPGRILVIPFQRGERPDYILCEALQRKIADGHTSGYTSHPWEWFYQTANRDSIAFAVYRENLARKLGAAIIIAGEIDEGQQGLTVNMQIEQDGESEKVSVQAASLQLAAGKLYDQLRQRGNFIDKKFINNNSLGDDQLQQLTQAKIFLLTEKPEKVVSMFPQADSTQVELLAAAYLTSGIAAHKDHPGLAVQEDETSNQGFRRLFNLILPYSKEGRDTAVMNILLARMYMHVKNYEMAEVCLTKAVTQQKYQARIYYYMSFLHESRYQEMGFRTRTEVLDHAVLLDPGYTAAIYELALGLYSSGTAAATSANTIRSIEILRKFLSLNPDNEQILSLLGRILLQAKYTPEAMQLFEKLIRLTDNAAEHHYNLGICYFHMKDYEKAEKQFSRAIEIDDYPDAYLYIGAINKLRGDDEKALFYYRERVKRKQGDDDTYAKEAMRGIRLILNDMAVEEEQEQANDSASVKN